MARLEVSNSSAGSKKTRVVHVAVQRLASFRENWKIQQIKQDTRRMMLLGYLDCFLGWWLDSRLTSAKGLPAIAPNRTGRWRLRCNTFLLGSVPRTTPLWKPNRV